MKSHGEGTLTLMGVRRYNPVTGRFLSVDPVPRWHRQPLRLRPQPHRPVRPQRSMGPLAKVVTVDVACSFVGWFTSPIGLVHVRLGRHRNGVQRGKFQHHLLSARVGERQLPPRLDRDGRGCLRRWSGAAFRQQIFGRTHVIQAQQMVVAGEAPYKQCPFYNFWSGQHGNVAQYAVQRRMGW